MSSHSYSCLCFQIGNAVFTRMALESSSVECATTDANENCTIAKATNPPPSTESHVYVSNAAQALQIQGHRLSTMRSSRMAFVPFSCLPAVISPSLSILLITLLILPRQILPRTLPPQSPASNGICWMLLATPRSLSHRPCSTLWLRSFRHLSISWTAI